MIILKNENEKASIFLELFTQDFKALPRVQNRIEFKKIKAQITKKMNKLKKLGCENWHEIDNYFNQLKVMALDNIYS
jgi:hypothetical protein